MATVIGGRYEVTARLGKGGMATIYGAEDTRLLRPVAIKVLDPNMVSDLSLRLFNREARAIAALRHNHIVQLYDYSGPDESPPYIVMERVDGLNLHTIIEKYSPLAEPVILTVLARVASALAHAHERGVVHRDLKPGNVMIERTGRVLLTDFGIAKAWANPTRLETVAGPQTGVIGTPAFMAPEQLVEEPVGPPADVFSLGSLIYCMATGCSPFEAGGPELVEVLRRILDTEFVDLLEVRPDLSRDLALQIDACLQRQPDARPTAEEVEKLCNGWLHQQAIRVPEQVVAELLENEDQTTVDIPPVVVELPAPARHRPQPEDAAATPAAREDEGGRSPAPGVAPAHARSSPGRGRKRQRLDFVLGTGVSQPTAVESPAVESPAVENPAARETEIVFRPAPAPPAAKPARKRAVVAMGIAAALLVAAAATAALWFMSSRS